jgi:outer membrane protein
MPAHRLAALLFLLAPGQPAAQSLPEALALTHASNPAILAARAALGRVMETVPEARAGWRPTIVMTGRYGAVDGDSRNTRTGVTQNDTRPLLTLEGSVTQPIWRGGATEARVRRTRNDVLAERARLMAVEQATLRDAAAAYTALVQAEQELAIRREAERIFLDQAAIARARLRAGEVTRTDVAQAESRAQGARADLSAALGTWRGARAMFLRLVGQPPGALALPGPLPAMAADAEAAGRLAMRDHPDVVAARFAEAGARDEVDVRLATLRPQIEMRGRLFREDNADDPKERETGGQITLNLTMPLYQAGAEHAAIRAARQAARQARLEIEVQRQGARRQAVEAFETRRAAVAQLRAVAVQLTAAEVALAGVRGEVRAGGRGVIDLLNAEQEVLDARLARIAAEVALVDAGYAGALSVGRMTPVDLALPAATAVAPADAAPASRQNLGPGPS